MKHFLAATRYLVFLAVLGALAISVTLLAGGLAQTYGFVVAAIEGSKDVKALALEGIVLVDVFLLGTVFLLIGLGLYALFIDDTLPVPAWLEIHTLDDLKFKLLNVVVVVLAVTFLGLVVGWKGSTEILHVGAAIALVIAALTYFLSNQSKK
jgi:uncharacterized membrane protein YqhA